MGDASDGVGGSAAAKGRIELRLRDLNQLFESLDPAPFREKDLDRHAEEFLVGWARECGADASLSLRLHLPRSQQRLDPERTVREAVQHYFGYRARLAQLDVRRILRQGRASLLIGTAFLVACMVIRYLLQSPTPAPFRHVLQEGLLIVGWVAMWRPLDLLLYDWWPVRQQRRIYERLSRMPVEVVYQDDSGVS